MLAYINGKIVPPEQAVISINDRGWLFGHAVFETMRTYNNLVFKLDEHLERLEQSAELAAINLPLSRREIVSEIDRLLEAQASEKDIMVRATISAGAGGFGILPKKMPRPTVVFQLRDLPVYAPGTFTDGWSIVTAKTRRNSPEAINPSIKSVNFLNNILAKKEAVEAGADDALMMNQDGLAAEGTISNFFIAVRGKLVTPPISDGILPGITRETVINLAGAGGLEVLTESIDRQRLLQADEAFFTLTSAGLIPITKIDNRSLGPGVGPVTSLLQNLYAEHVAEFVKGVVGNG